jgi:hypothetical protein
MVPPTTYFFTFDWFHFSRHRKCTSAHDPLHLHGLHRKPSAYYDCPM